MSVIIKGMKMPKNCRTCDIRRGCDRAYYMDDDSRPIDCPLIDLPIYGNVKDGNFYIYDLTIDEVLAIYKMRNNHI